MRAGANCHRRGSRRCPSAHRRRARRSLLARPRATACPRRPMTGTPRAARRVEEGAARLPAVDRVLVVCFAVFAFTSICMEPYITFGVDLARTTDPLGRAWDFYARTWDPLFLEQPAYMRVMTGIDEWVYGPMYLVLIYAFVRRRDWIRLPGLLYCGAVIY